MLVTSPFLVSQVFHSISKDIMVKLSTTRINQQEGKAMHCELVQASTSLVKERSLFAAVSPTHTKGVAPLVSNVSGITFILFKVIDIKVQD